MNHSKLIKILKDKYELNGKELAEKIGVSEVHISLLSQGKRSASSTLLERISYEFRIPVPILMWHTLTEDDIMPNKVQAFRLIKPSVDKLIDELI